MDFVKNVGHGWAIGGIGFDNLERDIGGAVIDVFASFLSFGGVNARSGDGDEIFGAVRDKPAADKAAKATEAADENVGAGGERKFLGSLWIGTCFLIASTLL